MSWNSSRKRRRSPPPADYDGEYKTMLIKEVELSVREEEPEKESVETTSAEAPMEAEDAASEPAEKKMDGEEDDESLETKAEETESAELKKEPTESTEETADAEPMDESAACDDAATSNNEEKPQDKKEEEEEVEEEKAKRVCKDVTSSSEKKQPKKPPVAQFYFHRQFTPYVVCRLSHGQQRDLKLFTAPKRVAASLVRCLLDESRNVVTRATELQAQLGLGEQYNCDDFQLEFITGRRQTSRNSHNHIALPLHAYFLFRLYHFKELRLQTSLSSDVRACMFQESWTRYCEERRHYLSSQATRAHHYHREDEDLARRYVRNYERAKDSQRRKQEEAEKAEAKAKADAEEKEKTEAEAEVKDEAPNGDAAAADEEQPEASSSTETTNGSSEHTSAAEEGSDSSEAKPAEESDANKANESVAQEASKSGSNEEEFVMVPEEISYVDEDGNHVAKSYYPLNQAISSTINGFEVLITFDPDNAGLPIVRLAIQDFPAVQDASVDDLENLVGILSYFCDVAHFGTICTVILRPSSSVVELATDIAGFLQRLNSVSIPVWTKAWKENRDDRCSTSAKSVCESGENLDALEPGTLQVTDWSEY